MMLNLTLYVVNIPSSLEKIVTNMDKGFYN